MVLRSFQRRSLLSDHHEVINKYFSEVHMDLSSSLVVSLRTMLMMFSFHCSHVSITLFTPHSPLTCALCLAQNWTEFWSKCLPPKGFIGRYMYMKIHNIHDHLFYQSYALQINFNAIKITLRYYLHLSNWPIFRSWTIYHFEEAMRKLARLMCIQNGSMPLEGNFAITW